MTSTRLAQLLSMLETEPTDSFLRYGVAMEYARIGRHAEAIHEFGTLLLHDPGYVAAFFMCGRSYESLGEISQARAQYEQGIAMAKKIGDQHAASEMAEALAGLPAT